MKNVDIPALTQQVSCLGPVDLGLIERIRWEIEGRDIDWTSNYSEYQSSGWLTVSLVNETGVSRDTTLNESEVRPTELLESLPHTRKLFDSLGLDIFWARIAKLEPNSFLWEHVDYTEFETKDRLRLHIPITSNSEARMVFENSSVQMAPGYLWKLDPNDIHGAANMGHTSRVHLILDCIINDRLIELLAHQVLPVSYVRELSAASPEILQHTLRRATRLAQAGFKKSAEHLVLKLFHEYALPPGETLKMLIGLYARLELPNCEAIWRNRAASFLGVL